MDMILPAWLTAKAEPSPVPADAYSTRVDGPPVHIYVLLDPETGEPRYVGKSIRPAERLANHMNERPSLCHRSHWLQSLKARGLQPVMVVLATISGAWPWQPEERYWIARLRAAGFRLTNNTSGGDGVSDLPAETRARMAATWKGRKHKPETIEKLRAARALRPHHSAETRAKMSRSQTGRVITWIDKVRASLRKFSPEQIARIKERLAAGEGVQALATEYGVHRTTLTKIKVGTYTMANQGNRSRTP